MPLTVPVVVKVPVASLSVNLTPLSRLSTGVKVALPAGATPTWTGPVAVTTWLLVVKVPGVVNSRPPKTLDAVGTARSSRDSRPRRRAGFPVRRARGLQGREKKVVRMTFLGGKSLPRPPMGQL